MSGLGEELWNVVGPSDPKMFEESKDNEWIDPLLESWEQEGDARKTKRTTTPIMDGFAYKTVQQTGHIPRNPSTTQQMETTLRTIADNVEGGGSTKFLVTTTKSAQVTAQQAETTQRNISNNMVGGGSTKFPVTTIKSAQQTTHQVVTTQRNIPNKMMGGGTIKFLVTTTPAGNPTIIKTTQVETMHSSPNNPAQSTTNRNENLSTTDDWDRTSTAFP